MWVLSVGLWLSVCLTVSVSVFISPICFSGELEKKLLPLYSCSQVLFPLFPNPSYIYIWFLRQCFSSCIFYLHKSDNQCNTDLMKRTGKDSVLFSKAVQTWWYFAIFPTSLSTELWSFIYLFFICIHLLQ